MRDRVGTGLQPGASPVLVNVKFASLVALTVSAPPPPVIVPLPVQPLTVKVFADAPPVRFATVMLLRPKALLNPAAVVEIGRSHGWTPPLPLTPMPSSPSAT